MEKHNLTKQEISELQEKLVQTCLNFINEKGIEDMDEIHFNADMLQDSARYGSWQPCTDSSIAAYKKVIGEHGLPKRELLQDYC